MLIQNKDHISQSPSRPGVTMSLLSGQRYIIIMRQLPGNSLKGDMIHTVSFSKREGYEPFIYLATWGRDAMTRALVLHLEHEDEDHTLDTIGR